MSTGLKLRRFAGRLVLCFVVVCLVSSAFAAAERAQKKTKKPPPPPLPSGPLGPVPQIPLDSIAPMAPQVTYLNGQLTIVAPNSTLGDVLRAVRKQTGAEIDVPSATDRVVTHLGPGPAREVMAELLNGSRFNYVLLGSAENESGLTRVVLVAKTGAVGGNPGIQATDQQPPAAMQAGNMMAAPAQEPPPDAADADVVEDNADDTAEQAADAEQPPAAPPQDQNGVKTPQQMLQEMQQRQLQLQQQQQPGQPPIPGTRPPQEQQ